MAKKVLKDGTICVKLKDAPNVRGDTLRLVEASSRFGISAFIGRSVSDNKLVVKGYLIDTNKIPTGNVLRGHKIIAAEASVPLITANRIYTTSSMSFYDRLIKADYLETAKTVEVDIVELAALNDKYFFYTKSVHEGPNANGAYFYRDEMIKGVRSMSRQMLDWEHYRDEVIGMSEDAELLFEKYESGEEQAVIGFNGVIWRTSPWVQCEDYITLSDLSVGTDTRDSIIRTRYFSDKLFTSMECVFDRIKCTACGEEFNDFMEFYDHKYTMHNNSECYYGMLNVDFVGNGIVEFPADDKASVIGLRTSDSGIIDVDIIPDTESTSGNIIEINREAARSLFDTDVFMEAASLSNALEELNNRVNNKNGDNSLENSDIGAKKDDNNIDNHANETPNSGGNNSMKFGLKEKCGNKATLADIFNVCIAVWSDFVGDTEELPENAVESFMAEMSEVVSAALTAEGATEKVYTYTSSDHKAAVESAKVAVANEYDVKLDDLKTELSNTKADLEKANATLSERDETLAEIEKAAEQEKVKSKVDAVINDIEKTGVVIGDSMKEVLCSSLISIMSNSDNDEELGKQIDGLKRDVLSMAKKSDLELASEHNGSGATKGDNNGTGTYARLSKIADEYKDK